MAVIRSKLASYVALLFGAIAAVRLCTIALGFVALPSSRLRGNAVARHYSIGKVNIGTEIAPSGEVPPPPIPVLECSDSCMTSIFDCLEDGCSYDAMAKLDEELAKDEQKIADSLNELKTLQKTAYTAENAGTVAWLDNFLSRSGSLRAQLHALKNVQDIDFVKQMVKAAAVAFGGARPNDYPKVGVSPYSA
jgi:hypothetical protein